MGVHEGKEGCPQEGGDALSHLHCMRLGSMERKLSLPAINLLDKHEDFTCAWCVCVCVTNCDVVDDLVFVFPTHSFSDNFNPILLWGAVPYPFLAAYVVLSITGLKLGQSDAVCG